MTTQHAQTRWRSLDTLFNTGALGVLTDPELLECFRTDRGAAGQEALGILVERHGPMVLGLCRSLVPDPHEAEDAFQATFLVLVSKGHAIWVRDSVGPWLHGVASRVARRARRRSIRRRSCQLPLVADIADVKAIGSSAAGQDTEQVIQEEVAGLPASLRAPIVLCALEGLSYDAAARQLGVTEPTLRGRLHRARRRLSARLRERGILSPIAGIAGEPFRLAMPALPPALVGATVQHSVWWSSLGGLVGGEAAIPTPIAAMARGVLRSMLLHTCKVLGIAAILAAGVLGTVVSAQQRQGPMPAATARAVVSPAARPPDEPAATATRPLPPQFQVLVAQHEEHLRKIRTLECAIDERVSTDGGQKWTAMSTWRVWKSGPRERIHQTTHRIAKGSGTFEVLKAPRGELDVLFAPDGIRSMVGYDPAHPPEEPVTMFYELTSKNRIGGLIRPPQPFAFEGYKTGLAADYLLLTLVDAMYSVPELCAAEVNAASKPAERRDPQGRPLWDLTLKAPPGHAAWDVRHEMPEGKYYSYVVTLSPRHGYAIVESLRITRVEKGAGQPDLVIHDRRQVLDVQEPAPGLFLPGKIRVTRTRSDTAVNPQYLGETLIHDVQVNGPVTDKELAFRFPRGIGVGDVTKDVYYIWGDGAPAATLTTNQYNEWRKQEMLKLRDRGIK